MYICFEWVVGTWKSTQSKKLVEYLQLNYPEREVVWTREPWWTEIAEAIRTLVQWTAFTEEMHPLTDVYLYASARAQSLRTIVKPVLDRWGIVVADRSFCTSLAYQWGSQWVGLDTVYEVNAVAVRDCKPDLIFFMDLDVQIGLSRTFDADGDKRERQKIDFFTAAHETYVSLWDYPPIKDHRHTIDASWSIEEVFARVLKQVQPHL